MWVKLVDGLGYPEGSIPEILNESYWVSGLIDPNCAWLINGKEWPELFGGVGPELIFREEPAYNAMVNTAKIIWLLKKSI